MENLEYFKKYIAPRNLRIALKRLNEIDNITEKKILRHYIQRLKDLMNSN